MPEYDFHQLSPYDLELLVRDLLQAEWSIVLESFKAGRDKGIDVRYADGADHIVAQVKHYLRTGISGLLRDLGKELPKIKSLKPKRYLVATSVPLSPTDKDKIVGIFGSKILALGDVLGQAELNNLLGRHSEIEQRHFKLWLASRAVLDRVLHNAEITRSQFKVQQVYQKAKRYVASSAYHSAFDMLNKQRVCIIAGPPGVGKTTLADLILYEHLEKGYQAVFIERDISEAMKLFEAGKPQIFYFDDFMGATFLADRPAGMAAVQDQTLLTFIAMIRESPHARLILTTREHIYSQALNRSERLRQSDLDDLRIVLHMPSYNFAQRARILYNHLYFSDLPTEYVDELLRDDFYLTIVKHDRFNPRLIEWLSSFRRIRNTPANKYRAFVAGLLNDPFEIWDHAYREELSDAGRSVLLAMRSIGGKAVSSRLQSSFDLIHKQRASRYGFSTRPEDFQSAMREVANVFLKPSGADGFEVLDPSVLDLLNAIIRRVPQNAVDIILGAQQFEQVKQIWSLAAAIDGRSILQALSDASEEIAAQILKLAVKERRIPLKGGGAAFLSPTYEERLATVIAMSERLARPAITKIVEPIFKKLEQEFESERAHVIEAADLIRTLELAKGIPHTEEMAASIRKEIIAEAADGCRGDELREIIGVVDTSNPESQASVVARTAFNRYSASYFSDDLHECRSSEQFDGLIEDLELFRDELKVDVDAMIQRVEEAKTEFEEQQDAYADHMQDEWKERGREERANDREVSDMFGSLKGDRD